MKCYMHVNFLEDVFPVPEIARRCAAVGYDGIELRGWDVADKLPLKQYLALAAKAAADNKLDLVFGCRTESFSPHESVRAGSLETLKATLRFCADHGVKILNVFAGKLAPSHHFEENGSAAASEPQWRLIIDFFRRAGDFAAPLNIDLCLETHNNYPHDLADPTRRLLEGIDRPNVKANFDYGNIHLNRANQGLTREMDLLAGRIGYVHLKNLVSLNPFDSRAYFRTPLDAGDINNFVLLRKLLGDGYRGPLTIENTMPGDKRRWMQYDLDYLKSILKDLENQ